MTSNEKRRLRVAALTHVGLRRQSNEDCIAIDRIVLTEPMEKPRLSLHPLDAGCVCLVADGMGGHPAGDIASRMVVETVLEGLAAAHSAEADIDSILHEANRRLFAEMARSPERFGMGTTLAGIVANESGIAAFNIGDSRIYAIEAGAMQQLSVDDSEPVGMGAFFHRLPARVLSQCLGGFPDAAELAPHIARLPTAEGAQFLICSDGLYDMLSDAAICDCIGDDPLRSAQALFEAAMDAGGIDNISVVLARIEVAA